MEDVFWKSLISHAIEHELLGQCHSHVTKCHTYFKAVRKSTNFIIIYITDRTEKMFWSCHLQKDNKKQEKVWEEWEETFLLINISHSV